MSDFTTEIKGHTLEYYDAEHVYLVDGVIVPSITQILKIRFKNKYAGVDRNTLKRASEAGTAVHEAIEEYCKTGEVRDLQELRNFQFLQKKYGFEVIGNEIPVILFDQNGEPISAGRLDMIIKINDKLGGADIKRTSVLDKEYLCCQLNLYRIAYLQSYGEEWTFLRGIHLREEKRKFVDIPINDDIVWELVNEYKEEKK